MPKLCKEQFQPLLNRDPFDDQVDVLGRTRISVGNCSCSARDQEANLASAQQGYRTFEAIAELNEIEHGLAAPQ